MKFIPKKAMITAVFTTACVATGLWLRAEDKSASDAHTSTEKLTVIEQNNQEIIKSLETIEQNINFIKARAMSGGRHS